MGWKVYFWVVTVLVFLNEERVAADGLALFELGMIVVEVVAVVALFGFAYGRRLASPRFWRVLAVLYVVLGVAVGARSAALEEAGVLEVLIVLLVQVPMYAGLWLYSRPAHGIWAGAGK